MKENDYKNYVFEIEEKFNKTVYNIKPLAGDGSKKKFYDIKLHKQEESFILMDLNELKTEDISKDEDSDWYKISKILKTKDLNYPQIMHIFRNKQSFLLKNCGSTLFTEEFIKYSQDPKSQKTMLLKVINIVSSFLSIENDNSLWTQRMFDHKLLYKELLFFKQHFLENYKKTSKADFNDNLFLKDCDNICKFIEPYSLFFNHRDFHSRNIMIDNSKLVIIDFQDARLGPASYDLVSFCFDPYLEMSLSLRKDFFDFALKELAKKISQKTLENIVQSWKSVALQRLLKALGSFAYLGKQANKNYFFEYIKPTIKILKFLKLEDPRWPYLSDILIKDL